METWWGILVKILQFQVSTLFLWSLLLQLVLAILTKTTMPARIKGSTQGTNVIQIRATTKPTENINIQITYLWQ